MKKIHLFRTIAVVIVVMNILNYFFLAASYSGIYVKESATLFDYTFVNYKNIDGYFYVTGAASDNKLFYVFAVLIIDLFLGYVLIVKTPKYGDYLAMPYKKINITCAIGILFHLFLFIHSVPSASFSESYCIMIGKGMLLNLLWIIGYIVIIELFYAIKKKKMTCNQTVKSKLSIFDVIILGVLIELVLSFFYCSLVRRLVVVRYADGVKHTMKYGQLFFSQFTMMLKHRNYYYLDGKVENYPYMIIVLLVIILQFSLVIIKSRFSGIMISLLSITSILVLTIGLCDMCDSFYTNYIKENSRNFFDLVGPGYYFVIVVNVFVVAISILPKGNDNGIVIGINEIEQVVHMDMNKKGYEDDETYIITLEKGEKVNEDV